MDEAPAKFKLWVCNGEERKCLITVSSREGSLWSTRTTDAYYSQVLDLSALDDGIYFVRVSNGQKSFEKKVTIETNSYVKHEYKIE